MIPLQTFLDEYHARLPQDLKSYELSVVKKGEASSYLMLCLAPDVDNNLQVNYGLTMHSFGAPGDKFYGLFNPEESKARRIFKNVRNLVTTFLAAEPKLGTQEWNKDNELRAVFVYAIWKAAVDAYSDALGFRHFVRKNVYEQMPKTSTEDMIRGIKSQGARSILAQWVADQKRDDFAAVQERLKNVLCASADHCPVFEGVNIALKTRTGVVQRRAEAVAALPGRLTVIFKGQVAGRQQGDQEAPAAVRPMFDFRPTEFPGETDHEYGYGARSIKISAEAYAALADKSYPLFPIGNRLGMVVEARTGGKGKGKAPIVTPLKPQYGVTDSNKIKSAIKVPLELLVSSNAD
jgi:hypothetical protein